MKKFALSDRSLSPGQTIASCQRNKSQHCWAQHVACVWPPQCCDILRWHVAIVWPGLYMEYMLQRARKSIMCYDQNKHERKTEANFMSSTAFCGRILSTPRKKDEESGTKTQNRQGFVWCGGCWSGYDAKTAKNSVTNTMNGVITIMKVIMHQSIPAVPMPPPPG